MRDGGGSGGGGGVSAVNGGRKKKHQRSRQGSDDFKGEERRRSVEVDKRHGSVESQQSRKSVDTFFFIRNTTIRNIDLHRPKP